MRAGVQSMLDAGNRPVVSVLIPSEVAPQNEMMSPTVTE